MQLRIINTVVHLSMLTRYVCRLFVAISNLKTPTPVRNAHPTSKRPTEPTFRIQLSRINDPAYFMTIINSHHSLAETNRMIKAITQGKTSLNSQNFQTVFKKYSYYIENIPKSPTFDSSTLHEKIVFLKGATTVYAKMGEIASARMLKCFNKVADQVFKYLVGQIERATDSKISPLLEDSLLVVLSVGMYNKKKSFAMMKSVQKYLKSERFLLTINTQSALYYLEVCQNLDNYNRLAFQTCLDVLKEKMQELQIGDFLNVLYSIGKSRYPINQYHASVLMNRMVKEFRRKIDPTTGVAFHANWNSIRQNIKMLQSLSLIEVNMKLASSYLPEFTQLLEIELFDISAQLSRMSDKDLRDYASLLRRSCYYDESLLMQFVEEITQREVIELRNLDFVQSQQQTSSKSKTTSHRFMTMNTFASCLHAVAIFNFRHPPVIDYFIETAKLIDKMKKLQAISDLNQSDEVGRQAQIGSIFHHKYYGRTIWSICVLCTKQELAEVYPLLANFLQLKLSNSLRFYDTLNFYYCYLLMKTYLPMKKDYFQSLIQNLESQQLIAEISETHINLYKTFIDAGIPALKQHNISNLMCDVFIPQYESTDGTSFASNIVIDLHGHHHFMRNCHRVKGGNVLKAKILASEGYIYQYIGVEEWGLADDKKAFVHMFMDKIALKFGKKQTKKVSSTQMSGHLSETTTLAINADLMKEEQQLSTKPIKLGQGRRRFKTNSRQLQAILNEEKN